MASTFAISRSHLIYGVCLPVAVVIGYLLAEPLESGSVAVVVLVLSILSIPLFMRWHHPLLIFSCNALILPYFLPGRPELWMVMAAISLFFSVLNRSIGQNLQFFKVRSVSYALIFLCAVVLMTAWLNGGVGLAALGSSNIGGKKYVGILAAVALYFALSTPEIKPSQVKLCIALFFLSALVSLVTYLTVIGGKPFYFLVEFFPIEGTVKEGTFAQSIAGPEDVYRFGTLSGPSLGLFCFLMAKHGARGILDLRKPWRLLLVFLAAVGSALGGFRSGLIILIMTYAALFYMEGLFRTRYSVVVLLSIILAGVFLLADARGLPYPVQRSLSFLPGINLDPIVRQDADGSVAWRVQIWKRMLPDVPKYLIKGKGYTMNPEELMMLQGAQGDAAIMTQEGAVLAGDYHSGPLSLIIPFGIFGVIAFGWFLIASVNVLRQNYRYGDPANNGINRFLLSYFVVKIVFFFAIFGGFSADMAEFAALIGLSVGLNGGVCRPPEPLPELVMDEPMSAEV